MNTVSKEILFKTFALNQWLSGYDDRAEECFDALMDCGENEEQFEAVCEEYRIDVWHHVEDWYFEFLVQQISDTYEAAKRLDEDLKEVTV